MQLKSLIEFMVVTIGVPKNKVSAMLKCDPKTVKVILDDRHGYPVVKIPDYQEQKSMEAGI